jgi:nicotinamide riboside kinase
VERVVILGRGSGGKSTLTTELARITALPNSELDKHF